MKAGALNELTEKGPMNPEHFDEAAASVNVIRTGGLAA